MQLWMKAGLLGLLAGSPMVIGALIGYRAHIPRRIVAGVMAFGSGILVSAISFDLMEEAYRFAGYRPAAIGFLWGAVVYSIGNWWLDSLGAKDYREHGKHGEQPHKGEKGGLAIALGALLDCIPESIVIGVGVFAGARGGIAALVAVFLSNFPEGLSSAAGMKATGRSARYVYGIWGSLVIVAGLSAVFGCAVFSGFEKRAIAWALGVAAGAIMAMLSDTMIPEAFEHARNLSGILASLGFLAGFALTNVIG